MAKIIIDSHYDIGGYRDVYEDRVATRQFTSAGGLQLLVAAVADGVGGENKGERAAQTALDSLFAYLERSRETNIPTLLTQAVMYANRNVHQLQKETGGASTTLSVAVIDESNLRLFIANVGDSRVYLCRNQKLTQLTIDHSFANVMPWRGQISPEAARQHPRAQALMRAIGPKDQIEVDLGFYVGTTDYEVANERGKNGLPIQDGDSILVCSDGLIKDSPKTGEVLVTNEEIVRTLHEKEGKKAAQELVSFALGRGSDDNVSAAVIQMPDQWRVWRGRRSLLALGAGALVVICGLIVGLSMLSNRAGEAESTAAALAQVQTGTAAVEQTVAAYTPTPTATATQTATPTPTLPPFEAGQAGINRLDGAAFRVGDEFSAGSSALQLLVYHQDGWTPPGYIYAYPSSVLVVDNVNDQAYNLSLLGGSRLFVENGAYSRVGVFLLQAASRIGVNVDGGCLAVDYTQPDEALLSCYAGACSYSVLGGISGEIAGGDQVLVDTQDLTAGAAEPIPLNQVREWAASLPAGSTAHSCVQALVPTPVPTRARTPTPRPTANQGDDEDPPTATKVPSATHTAAPTSTNTNRPPTGTNTSVPPTSTRTQTATATRTATRTNTPVTPSPTHTNTPTITPTHTPITPVGELPSITPSPTDDDTGA